MLVRSTKKIKRSFFIKMFDNQIYSRYMISSFTNCVFLYKVITTKMYADIDLKINSLVSFSPFPLRLFYFIYF